MNPSNIKQFSLIGIIYIILVCIIPTKMYAQYSMGTTGMMNIPTANMQKDGTFMAGGNYLPKEMTPKTWNYNTGNYFLNMTFLPFFEAAYRCTFFKRTTKEDTNWVQDRSVSLRFRPLKEGKYLPAIAIGSNDALTTYELNTLKESNSNRYFSSVYVVATKHINFGENHFNVSLGGYAFSKATSPYRGVLGGISYDLPFLKSVSISAEYDKNGIHLGTAAHLFGHLSMHLFAYDLRAISGGIRYEFCLIH